MDTIKSVKLRLRRTMPPKLEDINLLNSHLEPFEPQAIIRWAIDQFSPNIALSSSFQSQSVPLLHMVSIIASGTPVLFLDTGYHFPETLEFRDSLGKELGLNIKVLESLGGPESFKIQHGDLHLRNPDKCCYINKVEPLQRALVNYDAFFSGIRREQTSERANTPIISIDNSGVYKVCPLVNWTRDDVNQYLSLNNLPEHPLRVMGYQSIGCAPCTRPVNDGEDERAGRWAGTNKTECGLHTNQVEKEIVKHEIDL